MHLNSTVPNWVPLTHISGHLQNIMEFGIAQKNKESPGERVSSSFLP
jgi:hypothetical protein